MTKSESKSERGAKTLFAISATFSVVAVAAIFLFIFFSSVPALKEVGIFEFLFGDVWDPNRGEYGLLPMLTATLLTTLGALLIGGSVGVFSAIFLVYFCPKRFKGVFDQVIVLLAGIPSIIYGFFGMVVLLPFLRKTFGVESGSGLLASSLILGLMILPTVASLSKNALESVPASYKEGSLALGATKEQTVFGVLFPAAKKGILSALTLGAGRAIGETMAVQLVCGNSPFFPKGLFSSIRPLTVNIVTDMGYALGTRRSALFVTGLVLLVFVLLLNVLLAWIKREGKPQAGKERILTPSAGQDGRVYCKKGGLSTALAVVCRVVAGLASATLVFLIGYILVRGLPNLSLEFLFDRPTYNRPTLRGAFVSTFYVILISLAVAVPIGVATAIFLVEYAKVGSKFVKGLRVFIDTLSGIPSIVFGLFGMVAFCGQGESLLAGALTLSLMLLPTVIRSVEESLLAVPVSMREGSLALGASKVRTIFKVVLPSAASGIFTAVILSIGRIVSESAALIFTAGSVPMLPDSPLDSGATFAVLMYRFTAERPDFAAAYATAAVLLILVAIVNLFVFVTERKLKKGKK